mmetsp:Transcript_24405/g.56478  ORF Transcript_24405/g.56478 Transcript_24405/m.56478 type:complete len:206 (-) Transcript_24405:73-690(-)
MNPCVEVDQRNRTVDHQCGGDVVQLRHNRVAVRAIGPIRCCECVLELRTSFQKLVSNLAQLLLVGGFSAGRVIKIMETKIELDHVPFDGLAFGSVQIQRQTLESLCCCAGAPVGDVPRPVLNLANRLESFSDVTGVSNRNRVTNDQAVGQRRRCWLGRAHSAAAIRARRSTTCLVGGGILIKTARPSRWTRNLVTCIAGMKRGQH